MAEIITHSFVSAKTQSPDTTLVSKNEWNDGHALSGGINGQVITYDNTQDNNIRWIDGVTIFAGSVSSGATGSPYTSGTIVTVTCNTLGIMQLNPDLFCVTSGGAVYNITIKDNGSDILNIFSIPSGIQFTYPRAYTLAIGSHALSIVITATAGTFTSIALSFNVLRFGRL